MKRPALPYINTPAGLRLNVRMVWNGNFSGTEYAFDVGSKRHNLHIYEGDYRGMDTETRVRNEAEQWCIAYGIDPAEYNAQTAPIEFGGCL